MTISQAPTLSTKMCLVTTFRYLCDHDCQIPPAFEICNDITIAEFTAAYDLSKCRNFKLDAEVLQRNCPQCELRLEKLWRKMEVEAQKRVEEAAEKAERIERLAYRRVSAFQRSFNNSRRKEIYKKKTYSYLAATMGTPRLPSIQCGGTIEKASTPLEL